MAFRDTSAIAGNHIPHFVTQPLQLLLTYMPPLPTISRKQLECKWVNSVKEAVHNKPI